MDLSRSKWEPLLVFKFERGFFDFRQLFLSFDAFHVKLSSRFSNLSSFWVSGSPRNAAKGVNHSRIFYESPRMIDNLFRGSPRMFFNNISESLIQLSILLGDSTNLREGLV
jgi:hypothetical protein